MRLKTVPLSLVTKISHEANLGFERLSPLGLDVLFLPHNFSDAPTQDTFLDLF